MGRSRTVELSPPSHHQTETIVSWDIAERRSSRLFPAASAAVDGRHEVGRCLTACEAPHPGP